MRNVYMLCLSIFLCACHAQYKTAQSIAIIEIESDSILNSTYIYMNEVEVDRNSVLSSREKNLENVIQKLSKNQWIETTVPKERLKVKMEVYKKCLQKDDSQCKYTAEKYTILSQEKDVLILRYGYNVLGNYDEYFTYACYDIKVGKRIISRDIFKDVNLFLQEYNQRFNTELRSELELYTKEDYEYDIISDYIMNRPSFDASDTSNFELIWKNGQITAFKFYYNSPGGIYKSVLPHGYVMYTIKEIIPYLKSSFKKRLSL